MYVQTACRASLVRSHPVKMPAMVIGRSPRRKSSLAAEKRMQSQQTQDGSDAEGTSSRRRKGGEHSSDFEDAGSSDADKETATVNKKRKPNATQGRTNAAISTFLLTHPDEGVQFDHVACLPPARHHGPAYHISLMLDKDHGQASRKRLLNWFDTVSASRAMPWRKAWLDAKQAEGDPSSFRKLLERRAYEVWISEIMLQQTRVAVVIDYWNRWMARWPTIQDLAAAEPEEVVSAWRGLGYYSRATRIHEAAKQVVNDAAMQGLLPATAQELQAKVPGVGRYTGGAISAIVFGHPAPMVDGNVLRVLSRQLGLLGSVKTNKKVIDYLWSAADALAHAVADDVDAGEEKGQLSDRPGRWGQALMELGSTICTPKPDCTVCPIVSTCRAYSEGKLLAGKAGLMTLNAKEKRTAAGNVADIEDLCSLCEPYDEVEHAAEVEDAGESSDVKMPVGSAIDASIAKKPTRAKQATLSAFSFVKKEVTSTNDANNGGPPPARALEVIVEHAKRFPVKAVKKAVREEESIVCAVRRKDGLFLLCKRPDKGLLAGLWEFPSETLAATNDSTATKRKGVANTFVRSLLKDGTSDVKAQGELGSVPWLFSHLKLTMHTHLFTVDDCAAEAALPPRHRWATADEVEAESMGTGMRKCWSMVKNASRW